MLLSFDIGNTSIHMGLFEGEKVVATWRLGVEAESSLTNTASSLRTSSCSRGTAWTTSTASSLPATSPRSCPP
ncbi:MAG: type III pantothenate kinase [Dehalococcoidia bacterium]|nr:type III pantothenate kinase [Dehalococcoidia bacterium]